MSSNSDELDEQTTIKKTVKLGSETEGEIPVWLKAELAHTFIEKPGRSISKKTTSTQSLGKKRLQHLSTRPPANIKKTTSYRIGGQIELYRLV